MQIFSDLSMTSQATAGTSSASQLPFSFGMTPQEGAEFYDILQQTVQDLEAGTLNNDEIADKLSLIEETIPDELMTKIEQELNINTESDDKTDELSAKAFAVLNLVDNIIDDINKVENKSDLESSMSLRGVSQSNIETTIEMLDTSSETTDKSIEITQQEINKRSIIRSEMVSQFRATQAISPDQLSEKVLTGQQITNNDFNSLKNTESLTTKNPIENIEPQQATNIAPTPEKTTKEGQTLNEMLALFKKTKEEAINTGLNINSQKSPSSKTEATIDPTVKPVEINQEIPLNNNQTQTQATQQESIIRQESGKTNGAINKSEFKELNSKFVADVDADFSDSNPDASIEEFKPTNPTQATENNINMNRSFVNANSTTQQINMENIEASAIEQIQQTNEIKETQDAKLASNFNSHLYKLAQEANVQSQINVALKTFKDQNMQQLKIKLNPEELGGITIDMEMIDGTARGVITVERPEVAQQLAQNLKDLFQNFKQAGLEVDVKDIVVKVDDKHTQQESKQQNKEEGNSNELEFSFSENDLIDIQV